MLPLRVQRPNREYIRTPTHVILDCERTDHQPSVSAQITGRQDFLHSFQFIPVTLSHTHCGAVRLDRIRNGIVPPGFTVTHLELAPISERAQLRPNHSGTRKDSCYCVFSTLDIIAAEVYSSAPPVAIASILLIATQHPAG